MQKNNDYQHRLIAEPASEYSLPPEEQARKEEYRERLRQYLLDPEFRQIPGFPIGDNETILALSDPPYYTACPNSFLNEIIEEWQAERSEIQKNLDLLYDDEGENGYHREPFAADVSESKAGRIYNTHIYHTKVPHRAIMRYILHYTEPGDIIYDGFCGTGMTGVASHLCGNQKEIERLGFLVNSKGEILEGTTQVSNLGSRKAILIDLSPAATFIAHNQNKPSNTERFQREAERILNEITTEFSWMFETRHPYSNHPNSVKGLIDYTIWSEVFSCPECGGEMVFWDIAVSETTGYRKKKDEPLECYSCGMKAPITQLERLLETQYDGALGSIIKQVKRVPVKIFYKVGDQSFEKGADEFDLELIEKINKLKIKNWYPTNPVMFKGEKWGDTWRAGVHAGLTHIHHFYTKRSLYIWSELLRINHNHV